MQESGRIFDRETKERCWQRAPLVPGRDPKRWRMDAVGNIVCHELRGCMGCLCHEYDHIVPFSRGGRTTLDNCQVLQTRANRYKGNDPDDPQALRAYSCSHRWQHPWELDAVEMAVYGDVRTSDGSPKCRVKSNFELFAYSAASKYKLPRRLAEAMLVDNCPNFLIKPISEETAPSALPSESNWPASSQA